VGVSASHPEYVRISRLAWAPRFQLPWLTPGFSPLYSGSYQHQSTGSPEPELRSRAQHHREKWKVTPLNPTAQCPGRGAYCTPGRGRWLSAAAVLNQEAAGMESDSIGGSAHPPQLESRLGVQSAQDSPLASWAERTGPLSWLPHSDRRHSSDLKCPP
jgi:hypothetical protein